MNNKHWYWIAPVILISLIISMVIGSIITSIGVVDIIDKYPSMNCIFNMEHSLDIDHSILYKHNKDNVRKAIEIRCAQESIDLDADVNSLFNQTKNEK